MYVIGTAGHVDHGKSTLVRALTGIDPDRLKEEKARQMTIDLGFAWFTLPDENGTDLLIGVVDVPGHRDFIENMLAGVGGINAVIFVIAADEGIMPQTREHLAIIDLLRIPTGIIALTKIDLVPDADWLEIVQVDILEAVQGTVLQDAPIVPLSARTGQGLSELRQALSHQLARTPLPADIGKPRLWIDRVFSVSGFGTVVTGTLLGGSFTIGQEITLLPDNRRGKIRGLQSHNQPLEVAQPGSRVAVNISGIDKTEARRGQLLTLPDLMEPSRLISARFTYLPDVPRPLKHNAEVKFFCGSAETIARVRLLDTETFAPGESGWIQVELVTPLPLVKGDRFILRYPSPATTIGGGDVVQTGSNIRYRRHQASVIAGLEALTRATPDELILYTLNNAGKPLTISQISDSTGLSAEIIERMLHDSLAENVRSLGNYWITHDSLNRLTSRLVVMLAAYHKSEPLRTGMRSETLSQQLQLEADALVVLIDYVQTSELVRWTATGTVALYQFVPQPNKAQRIAIDHLMKLFAETPFTPPSIKDALVVVGVDVLDALIEWRDLVKLSTEVLMRPDVLREFATATKHILKDEGVITIKRLRDEFTTSRKYAQAVLEYFDAIGLTSREGDDHVIGEANWNRFIE
jgi:selenocysteine-specific elongation factor